METQNLCAFYMKYQFYNALMSLSIPKFDNLWLNTTEHK